MQPCCCHSNQVKAGVELDTVCVAVRSHLHVYVCERDRWSGIVERKTLQ